MKKLIILFISVIILSVSTLAFLDSLKSMVKPSVHSVLTEPYLQWNSGNSDNLQLQVVDNSAVIEFPENAEIHIAAATSPDSDSVFFISQNDHIGLTVVTSKNKAHELQVITAALTEKEKLKDGTIIEHQLPWYKRIDCLSFSLNKQAFNVTSSCANHYQWNNFNTSLNWTI